MVNTKTKEDAFENFDDEDNTFSTEENKAPEGDKEEKELPITVKLKRPIDIGSKRYESLTFKFPVTVGMMKHAPSDAKAQKVGHFIPIICGMTGEPATVIEMLSPSDFGACSQVVADFL